MNLQINNANEIFNVYPNSTKIKIELFVLKLILVGNKSIYLFC